MTRFISISILVAAVSFLSGCAPRGETITLDQVLAKSRSAYTEISKSGLPLAVGAALEQTSGELDTILKQSVDSPATLSKSFTEISDSLSALATNAGYTQRAAFTEMANQYREMGSMGGAPTTDQVRLLAARTFTLLTAELSSTRFSVNG